MVCNFDILQSSVKELGELRIQILIYSYTITQQRLKNKIISYFERYIPINYKYAARVSDTHILVCTVIIM